MKIKGSGGRNVLGRLAVMIGLLMCPLPVLADEDGLQTHVLDEIVVTSTSKTKMIDTPASISVITAADLEQMGAKNIIEALERIPGVYNTSASSTSLSIRGTRSSMAGGPVILVDGVPQKYGNNRREELDLIPVSQIARIEVLRSAGIAYGPGGQAAERPAVRELRILEHLQRFRQPGRPHEPMGLLCGSVLF